MDLLSSFLVRADALRTVEWAAKVLNALARLNAYYARASGRGETHLSADLLAVNEELHRALDLSIPAEELDFTALKAPHETTHAPLPDIEAETRRYPWWGPKLPGVDDESAEDEGSADAEESIDGSASDDDESCSEDEGGSDDGNASADVGEDAAIAERGA